MLALGFHFQALFEVFETVLASERASVGGLARSDFVDGGVFGLFNGLGVGGVETAVEAGFELAGVFDDGID